MNNRLSNNRDRAVWAALATSATLGILGGILVLAYILQESPNPAPLGLGDLWLGAFPGLIMGLLLAFIPILLVGLYGITLSERNIRWKRWQAWAGSGAVAGAIYGLVYLFALRDDPAGSWREMLAAILLGMLGAIMFRTLAGVQN